VWVAEIAEGAHGLDYSIGKDPWRGKPLIREERLAERAVLRKRYEWRKSTLIPVYSIRKSPPAVLVLFSVR
jgi:hypothetical protein